MATNTSYGTWNNHTGGNDLTVEQTIIEAVAEFADDFDIDAIITEYKAAIDEALPADVGLCGDEFIGPAYDADKTWGPELEDEDGRLDIAAIVESVDLWAIIARHDTSASNV